MDGSSKESQSRSAAVSLDRASGASKESQSRSAAVSLYGGAKAFGVPIEKYLYAAIQNGRTLSELGLE